MHQHDSHDRNDQDAATAAVRGAVEESERQRDAELIITALQADKSLDWTDRERLIREVRAKFSPDGQGRKTERSSVKLIRWLDNPVNAAALTADWLIRYWRRRGRVTRNNRVEINGEPIPLHKAAARKAIDHLKHRAKRSGNEFRFDNVDQVVAALRRGRTEPPQ